MRKMSSAAPPPPIELLPCAGLANRLRAMASALAAAREIGRPLVIAWPSQPGILSARPEVLFDLSACPFEVIADHLRPYKECLSPYDWERISAAAAPSRPLYIKSHGHFYQTNPTAWTAALRDIRPHPDILRIATTIPPNTVGVHIRRTDNAKSIAESSTASFEAVMASYPPTQAFFLATDDPAEQARIESRFASRLLTATTHFSRSDTLGVAQAFLDLLCLSRCREILGSAGSSFGEIAAALGGVPLRVIRDV